MQPADSTHISQTRKMFIADKQMWKCGHCSNNLPAVYHISPIIPFDKGGSNQFDNLVALCYTCFYKNDE
jgi:5-methylcytosine-specific restriction endonuclease McrA